MRTAAHANFPNFPNFPNFAKPARRGCAWWALLLPLVLLVMPGAAQAHDGWVTCADEGQLCRVNGVALVRFGADSRFAHRVIVGRVGCDTEAFGDPAPGRRKQCQVSTRWRQADPDRGGAGADVVAAEPGWRVCAAEGEMCRLPEAGMQMRVRYGRDGQYVQRYASGSIMCLNGLFGDPVPDVGKRCEYAVGATGQATPTFTPPGPPTPAWSGSVNERDWQRCADEGGECRFSGLALLRFGLDGRWVYREAQDGLACRNDRFGSDPAPGQRKWCEWRPLRR